MNILISFLILFAFWLTVGIFGIFVFYKMEVPEMQNQMRRMFFSYIIAGACLGGLVWYEILFEEVRNG